MKCTQVLFSFLIFNLIFSQISHAEEKISNYEVSIYLKDDSTLEIKEVITVNAEGHKIKRGIFRDFPTDYPNANGIPTIVDFTIVKVLRDDLPETYHTERMSNGTRIYLGDKNKLLSYGTYKYEINFTTVGQVGFFKDHDELYFNAIGQGWDFPIENVEVNVILPNKIPPASIKVDGFTGRTGSTARAFTTQKLGDNQFKFRTTKTLAPHEGFTFVVAFEKGIIKKPTVTMQLNSFLKRYYNAIIGTFVSAAGFLILFLGWVFRGIDPKKGTIIPRFSPPEDFSPAAVLYLQNMGYSPKCLSSLIVSAATKGAIKITEEDPQIIFMKNKIKISRIEGQSKDLTIEEDRILDLILGGSQEIEVDKKNFVGFAAAKSYLSSTLKTKLQPYYNLNSGIFAIGCIAQFFATYLVFSSGLTVLGFFFLAASILNFGVFSYLIKRYSEKGRKILDEVEGFKMYLETAEKDSYENITYPEISQSIFERFLPYAVALGAEASWMKGFKNALEKAGKDYDQYQPRFYSGNIGNFNTNSFSKFSSNLTDTISSASTAPSKSSGSSGGGFSGGGGGGGGGGGW